MITCILHSIGSVRLLCVGLGDSVGARRPFTISCTKDGVGLASEVAAEWEGVVGL